MVKLGFCSQTDIKCIYILVCLVPAVECRKLSQHSNNNNTNNLCLIVVFLSRDAPVRY